MKIARNANDILSKHLTNACPRGVLDVIGITDANIVRALPTELNQVIIRNRNTDIVLEQDNGSLLHLEFQLSKEPTLYRFAAYDFALAEHFLQKLRTVVLYTGDIQEGPTNLDIGTAIYQVENIYLNRLNGDEALAVVEHHLANDTWTPQDRVRLAFAFHMHFEQHTQERSIRRGIDAHPPDSRPRGTGLRDSVNFGTKRTKAKKETGTSTKGDAKDDQRGAGN